MSIAQLAGRLCQLKMPNIFTFLSVFSIVLLLTYESNGALFYYHRLRQPTDNYQNEDQLTPLTAKVVDKVALTLSNLIQLLKNRLLEDRKLDRGCYGNTARAGLGQMCMPIIIRG